MDRGRYLIRNVGILTISNFSSKILAFLLVPIYTSVLSVDDVGIYDIVISTIALLYPVLTANIADAVMRFTMDREKDKNEIIAIASRHIIISWICAGLLLVAFKITNVMPLINGYESIIYAYFCFTILYQILLQFSKGLERVGDMGIAGVLSTLSMIGGNILFLVFFKTGLMGFFVANTLAQAIPSTFLFIRLKFWRYLKCIDINHSLRKEMLAYCIPLIATTLGWWINSTCDKYAVAIMCGVNANGLLSVAYKIPQIIITLQGIFIQAWQISAIKEYGGQKTREFYGRSFAVINLLMCATCMLLIFLTKPLAHLLYRKSFFVAWQYVPFLLISCVFNSAAGFLGPILSAKRDSVTMAKSAIYGGFANMVLNVAFIYVMGIQGATIATMISSYIIYHYRKHAVHGEVEIHGYERVIITWVLICLQAMLEIYTPLWWFELVLIVAAVVLNLKTIKEILIMFRGILFGYKQLS